MRTVIRNQAGASPSVAPSCRMEARVQAIIDLMLSSILMLLRRVAGLSSIYGYG